MKRIILLFFLLPLIGIAQKKPLDHSVYDGWQTVGPRVLSNDGKWVVYTVTPQEGDGTLYIESLQGPKFKMEIDRAQNASISEDSRFVVFRIKPFFKDTREAQIKKKKPEDMPKDSMGLVELGKTDILKVAGIKSFRFPEKGAGWLAYQLAAKPAKPAAPASSKVVDSLKHRIDSLTKLLSQLRGEPVADAIAASIRKDTAAPEVKPDGDQLVLRTLATGKEITFNNTGDYSFDESGKRLVMHQKKNAKDSASQDLIVIYYPEKGQSVTIMKGGNVFKNFTFNENGDKLAFVAEREKDKKAVQKFYDLYLYSEGADSALQIVNKDTRGMPSGSSVSENGNLRFSKSGKRLMFGTAPIRPPKDTTLIEMDLVKLDIWNYKDDYLQPQQLKRLTIDQRANYMAVYDLEKGTMQQIGSPGLPSVQPVLEGDGNWFLATTDTGSRRIASQWLGKTPRDIYVVDVNTGKQTLVKKNFNGFPSASPGGKYIQMYDATAKNYFVWDNGVLRNISQRVPVPLFDELNDVPDDPRSYGTMDWEKDDAAFYVYDRYDIWKLDPTGKNAPVRITPDGRKNKKVYRYMRVDREEKFLTPGQEIYLSVVNDVDKSMALVKSRLGDKLQMTDVAYGAFSLKGLQKAKNAESIIYTKESYVQSPDLYAYVGGSEEKLSAINPQQASYNWGTAALFSWTTFSGKKSEGIVYKPEDFDSTKKYPVILYFYERLTDGLNNYQPPSPTPSRLNISFFVSRGYVVFAPDIAYVKGHPGNSAYDYIVSGAQALAKKKWIDGSRMGIQGQSWGGYQVAYLITKTNMFKAAWAGAPVVNMFSAYGGIRWGSGMNRQFQYEHTQSRIGATIWERPDLYTENSPLFHFRNVKTPVVIMANDNDGAVPWYQGIEMFTALRRLGKPVWMLNYNGEEHNLVERKNRKDIQIREQQFFDWLLKGDKAPRWITEGVPAIDKGRDWGLGYE
ncbi:MAG: S9 family peptidase [Chitinophagaceae bacterium]|nr:S9 family peptidase [Chitinophagaceae bacterium]MCZ2397560.1 prolyl oligopeptidase family serine peptidase [Chitinophagales bacterium]